MLSPGRFVSASSASFAAVALLLALASGCDGDVTRVDSGAGSGTGGAAPLILGNGKSPRLLRLNSAGVFFVALNATSTGGAIYRAAKDGSSFAPVTAESPILPDGLAVNDASVFWTEAEYNCVDCSPDWGRVYAAPINGGAPILLVETAGATPSNAVVDEAHVYWIESTQIRRVLLGGGDAETILAGAWPHELALDKTRLYWTPVDVTEPVIMSADKFGAGQGPLCITSLRASQLTYNETWLYWTSHLDNNATTARIERINTSGGAPSVVLSSISTGYFAVHQGFVYWTELKQGRVLRAPAGGGPPEVLAAGLTYPSEIAVDDSGIYWLTGLSELGAVMRLPLP